MAPPVPPKFKPWNVIGKYRLVPLPELPLPSGLPHRLGYMPSFANNKITYKPTPTKSVVNSWRM